MSITGNSLCDRIRCTYKKPQSEVTQWRESRAEERQVIFDNLNMPWKSEPSVSEVVEFIIDLIEHQQHTKKNMVEDLARCERFWCVMTELTEDKWFPEKEVYSDLALLKNAIIEASHEQDTETTMFTYYRLWYVRYAMGTTRVQVRVKIIENFGNAEMEEMEASYTEVMGNLKNMRQELEELVDSMFSVNEDSDFQEEDCDEPAKCSRFMSVPLLVDNCFSGMPWFMYVSN